MHVQRGMLALILNGNSCMKGVATVFFTLNLLIKHRAVCVYVRVYIWVHTHTCLLSHSIHQEAEKK